jgi:uncharacterized protein YwqG
MNESSTPVELEAGTLLSAKWQPFLPALQATKMPFVRITATKDKFLPLMVSKFGGDPYWPDDQTYPVDVNGEPMALLAQINFADMPPLPHYPTSGLLQFFVCATDDLYGADLDEMDVQENFQVIYHPTTDREPATHVPTFDLAADDLMLPIASEFGLSFAPAAGYVSYGDIRFETTFGEQQQTVEQVIFDDEAASDEYHALTYPTTTGHKIGGYAYFTQADPRNWEANADYRDALLLLQIDSTDDGIMWGDSGVGSFFINRADLRARDFSRVMYTWDCM